MLGFKILEKAQQFVPEDVTEIKIQRAGLNLIKSEDLIFYQNLFELDLNDNELENLDHL